MKKGLLLSTLSSSNYMNQAPPHRWWFEKWDIVGPVIYFNLKALKLWERADCRGQKMV